MRYMWDDRDIFGHNIKTFFTVLDQDSRALNMLEKCSVTEFHTERPSIING